MKKVLAILLLAACAKKPVVVGSKNFTEAFVLGEIYAQALQAAGYKVKKQLNLGDEKTALKALKAKAISAYPEYTGTALGSFFNVKSSAIPKDPIKAYDLAKAGFLRRRRWVESHGQREGLHRLSILPARE